MPLPPALLANTCCASPKSWTNRIQRHNPMHHQCAAAGMSPYGWLHLVVKSRQAQGLSEVSIMPLAAISRISSSAAFRLARGSLWGCKRMGAAGLVSMLCCTRAVLVQSSSRAAKMSTKSLNRCRSCSCCGVLRCSTFRRPNSSTATTVLGDGEADGVCGGNGWGVLVWATIFLQGSPWVSLALVRWLGAGAGEHWCLGGGCGAVASPWWLQPDRSGTVLLWRHRAAPGISTHASQWANNAFISDVGEPELVARLAHPHHHRQQLLPRHYCPFTRDNEQFGIGWGPVLRKRTGCSWQQMVDTVFTRALQGCPPTTQSRYSPLASPQRPTIGQSWWRGDKERGEGPLTASLRGRFPAVTLSGARGSEQGSPWQSAPVLRSESSGLIWTSVGGSTLVGPGWPPPPQAGSRPPLVRLLSSAGAGAEIDLLPTQPVAPPRLAQPLSAPHADLGVTTGGHAGGVAQV